MSSGGELLAEIESRAIFLGRPAPDTHVLQRASSVLQAVQARALAVSSVSPDVEGGVGIYFCGPRASGRIALLNDGDAVAHTIVGRQEPEVWDFDPVDTRSISATVDRVRAALG